MQSVMARLDSLINHVQKKEINQITNLDLFCLSWNLLYSPFSWNRSTTDALNNSGSLQMIKSDSLSSKIRSYNAFLHHLDEDYEKDINRIELIREQLSSVVNSNYPNLDELHQLLTVNWDHKPLDYLFHFYNSPEYKRAEAYSLDLLTDDINDIRKVINTLIQHVKAYDVRANYEMVRLIEDASDIQKILRIEYLQKEY